MLTIEPWAVGRLANGVISADQIHYGGTPSLRTTFVTTPRLAFLIWDYIWIRAWRLLTCSQSLRSGCPPCPTKISAFHIIILARAEIALEGTIHCCQRAIRGQQCEFKLHGRWNVRSSSHRFSRICCCCLRSLEGWGMRVTASSLTGLAALRFRVPLRAMPVAGHEDKLRLMNNRKMYK